MPSNGKQAVRHLPAGFRIVSVISGGPVSTVSATASRPASTSFRDLRVVKKYQNCFESLQPYFAGAPGLLPQRRISGGEDSVLPFTESGPTRRTVWEKRAARSAWRR